MSLDSLNSSMLRLTGLSSGLDTDTIIEGLMTIEQSKLDKMESDKTDLEWKEEAYREINNKLRAFREEFMSVLSPDTNMNTESAYNIYDVTMIDSTTAVSVTAGSDALSGTVTIDSITQLAEAAELESSSITTSDSFSLDTALSDLELTQALEFDENDEISFSINDQTFTFSKTDTLNDMILEINQNSDADVKISYSTLSKGLTIRSKEMGADSEIEIVNISGNAFSATDSAFGISEGTVNGQDAMLSINGYSVEKSDNSFTIDGISYSLKGTSDSSISFSIERNVDDTMDRITSFIDKYNDLVEELNEKYTEDIYYTYDPLTEDQEEELTDDEIEKWTDMAKSGNLRSDSYLSTLLTSMRNSFYTTVESVGMSPSEIGIESGSYSERNKIVIDEDVLRQAIENNPDQVASLFVSKSSSEDSTEFFNESGLIKRISNAINDYIEQTSDVAIEELEKKIDDAEERIEDQEDWMDDRLESLYAKFTVMETALSTLNSQSTAIAGWTF